jgi:NADH dehydrogenase FAD-containing subunit
LAAGKALKKRPVWVTLIGNLIRLRVNGAAASFLFRYFNKGDMAAVGQGVAILQSGRFCLSGLLTWRVWATVNLQFLAAVQPPLQRLRAMDPELLTFTT